MKRILMTGLAFAFTTGLAAAALAGDAAAGKLVFTGKGTCWTCHGQAGKGDGPAGKALNPPPRDFSVGAFKFDADKDGKPGSDADLKLVITKGAGAFGGNPTMAPWGHLSAKEVDDVIAFVRTLKK
ncbi:MAG TPA: cytochrome c [Myxococcota bacterium]|jgi:mono/diheme cytochrome c family protein